MLLNVLIILCIAAFVGFAVLGHILLVGDAWRFWAPVKEPQQSGSVAAATRMPAK